MARVILGTRGSDLARAQARQVEQALHGIWPELQIVTEIIVTQGDERAGVSIEPIDRHAGRKGLFTREIERALRDGTIDVAVHSAKDLPSDADENLMVAATLPRVASEDLFVSKIAGAFHSLGEGAVVATGSVRRQHQLLAVCPSLCVTDVRGNVPTRLRKLLASDWAGIILARAGLERLGFIPTRGSFEFEGAPLFAESLSCDEFLPAGGQGTIALQVRAADRATLTLVDAICHRETLMRLRAEREFLRLLEGDCDSPVGVFATIDGDEMKVSAQVFTGDQTHAQWGEVRGELGSTTPEKLAAELMEKIHG